MSPTPPGVPAARVLHPARPMSREFPEVALARVEERDGGRVVVLESPAGRAEVHEHGAHVTSWTPPDGRGEALFLSQRARLDGRAAIRGGVPVIFPQFGPGPLPKHGFARTRRWTLEDAGLDGHALAAARFTLRDDPDTRATWPYPFAAELEVALEGRTLAMTLAITNTGDERLAFTAALHTYLRVGDVARAQVRGLENVRLRDQLTRVETESPSLPVGIAGPVDRVYLDVPRTLHVDDAATGRTVRVETAGFRDAVLWNPWIEGAQALDDMQDDEWRVMLCLEPAVVATPVALEPGERWSGVQRLSVEE